MSDFEVQVSPYPVDPEALTALYTGVGWNRDGRRTPARNRQLLGESRFYASVQCAGTLVGFGRVLGDVYACQILDVITDPAYRRRGVATLVMDELMRFCRAHYPSVQLVDGSGVPGFYERFGFVAPDYQSNRLLYWSATE
jgi:ribosomal protein S18 acetylase RimI-like enzyme